MDKIVKIGIIGTGNMGAVHLGFFLGGKVKGAVVTAVADTDPDKLAQIRRLRPGDYRSYESGDALIERADVDAVIIATPHYSHPRLAVRAFARGLAVLCEKPAGVTAPEVREMNAAADKAGSVFSVMFNQRYNPLHRKIREICAGGQLGALKRVGWTVTNWYRTQRYYDSAGWRATWAGEGGGVLINQAVHQLDLLQWFTGMPKSVRAFCGFGRWHDVETEDDVTAYLDYGGGATGVFVTSTGEAHGVNRLEISGSRGRLLLEGGALKLTRYDCDERDFCYRCGTSFGQPGAAEEVARMTDSFDRHVELLNNFAAAVRGEEALFVDGREGLNSVLLLNAMLYSAWQNREVAIPFDEEGYASELSDRAAKSRIRENKNHQIEDNTSSFGGF